MKNEFSAPLTSDQEDEKPIQPPLGLPASVVLKRPNSLKPAPLTNQTDKPLSLAVGEMIMKALRAGLKSSVGPEWPPGPSLPPLLQGVMSAQREPLKTVNLVREHRNNTSTVCCSAL